MRRSTRLTSAAVALALAGPAHAIPLIGFTDNGPNNLTAGHLTETTVNWAVAWSQTIATSNVTVRAVLDTNVGAAPANWWITDAIGLGTGAGNVIASGQYTAPDLSFTEEFDFDSATRTTLAGGLSFAPGTYFLVLDGLPGPFSSNVDWIGDGSVNVATNLLPGFTLGAYQVTLSPTAFGPAATFTTQPGLSFAFELEGDVGASIPEPDTWALMMLGFGLAGAARWRSRRSVTSAG